MDLDYQVAISVLRLSVWPCEVEFEPRAFLDPSSAIPVGASPPVPPKVETDGLGPVQADALGVTPGSTTSNDPKSKALNRIRSLRFIASKYT
jgi:hypothetical protein